MAKLFSMGDVKNHPRRSGFDLSSKNAFTAKVGELLPVYWKITMPGDKFTMKTQWFTRTQPVNTAAYTRIREYFDWMYVPLHLLWRHFPEVVTQMQNNVQHAGSFSSNVSLQSNLPYMTNAQQSAILASLSSSNSTTVPGKNQFGFDRADLAQKLFQYLNYGNNVQGNTVYGTNTASSANYTQQYLVNSSSNVFALLAYQKFYQDWYRYSQWENSSSYTWNIDYYSGNGLLFDTNSIPVSYWKSNTMFDLRYANWNKDLFMGVLPNSQYGAIATVGSTFPESDASVYLQSGSVKYPVLNANSMGSASGTTSPISIGNTAQLMPANSRLIASYPSAQATFDILSLRQSEALQRWKEVSQCSSQNYKSQIKAHFGVELPDIQSGMSRFIDGAVGNLDISEVINSNLQSSVGGSGDYSNQEATIAGKGVGTGDHFTKFYADDWGILMCVYHAVPLLDYVATGPDPQLLSVVNTDLPIPEMDSIGMQALPSVTLSNSYLMNVGNFDKSILGYTPRYIAFKTDYDRVHGAFTTSLSNWVAPISQVYLKQFLSNNTPSGTYGTTYQLFKVNPTVVDSIFTVSADSKWDSDQLLVNSYFEVRVARNLDYDGMPY